MATSHWFWSSSSMREWKKNNEEKDKEKVWLLVQKGMSLKLQWKAAEIVHEIDAIKEKILFSAE